MAKDDVVEMIRGLVRPLVTFMVCVVGCALAVYETVTKGNGVAEWFIVFLMVIANYWFVERQLKNIVKGVVDVFNGEEYDEYR